MKPLGLVLTQPRLNTAPAGRAVLRLLLLLLVVSSRSTMTTAPAEQAALPPTNALTRDSFAFYRVPLEPIDSMQAHTTLRGVKGREGHIFVHRSFNEFEETETEVPAEAEAEPVPADGWLSSFFWDPAKHHLVADPDGLPALARGAQYAILDNGGTPFVLYAREDSASIFKMPPDGYLRDGDWTGNLVTDRLFFTHEVATYQCSKIWAGVDPSDAAHKGNSVLLQMEDVTRYVYVGGSEIYTFTLEQPIVEYFSRVGNSAVPYPVGLTESSALFMLDRVLVARDALAADVPRGDDGEADWSDAYQAFYGYEGNATPLADCTAVSQTAELEAVEAVAAMPAVEAVAAMPATAAEPATEL